MQRYHSNSIRCLFLLLDTHPRAAPVIGRALFWCHRGGNRMMGILTHERKRQRRLWLAASRGPHSGSREIHSEPRLPLDGPHVRLEEAGGSGRLFLFFFLPSSSSASFFSLFASVREPSGDQLVTRRPWVSTREYGGWDRAGDRGGDGDKPEMVKEKQRGASFFNQVSTQLPACAAFPPLGLLPENVAPALHCRGAGASVFSPRCPRWSKFVFCFFLFWCRQSGELSRWEPARSTSSGDLILLPVHIFGHTRGPRMPV